MVRSALPHGVRARRQETRYQWIGERRHILGLANVIVNLRNATFDVVAFY